MEKMYVLLSEVPLYEGDSVCIKGWVTHVRSSGKLIFIEVRDGTGTLQCVVFKNDVSEGTFADARALTLETSLEIEGTVSRDKRSKLRYEISVINVYIIHLNDDSYSISAKAHGVAFLLDKRHLWLRSSRQRAILLIRATVINAARQFLNDRGFFPFDPPILTPTSCEGT